MAITAFWWEGGFHPIVGVTLIHPINVTLQNDDVTPVFGLALTAKLLHRGIEIGGEGVTRIDRLDSGEKREISAVGPRTTIGTSLSDAMCVVRLTVGDIVLDEWVEAI